LQYNTTSQTVMQWGGSANHPLLFSTTTTRFNYVITLATYCTRNSSLNGAICFTESFGETNRIKRLRPFP